ncbi:hypothetical protein BHE74_00034267 [Ensete ventricosum]|nr:hypothetical protein BHE74_00034267 [Ensete ventricosum]
MPLRGKSHRPKKGRGASSAISKVKARVAELAHQLEDTKQRLAGLIKQLKQIWGNNRAMKDELWRLSRELYSMRMFNLELDEEVTIANGEVRELRELLEVEQHCIERK